MRRSVEYMTGVRARPTEAGHAVFEIEDIEDAIANLSDAMTEPTYTSNLTDQVGGSVVGEDARSGPLRLGKPLRDSTRRGLVPRV